MTKVFCTLQVEGVHHWPTCDLKEVEYLKHPHRHMFHIKAFKKVSHEDRDCEFICLKHQVEVLLMKFYNPELRLHDFGAQSCEMIASSLWSALGLESCEVSEDGENGAVVS